MAELPSKVHLTSHPMYLSIRGPFFYEDENQRPWMYLLMNLGGVLHVQLCQIDYPSEPNGITTSPPTSSNLPLMWMLHHSSQYLDSMGRFWRILHHIKEDDIEEMLLVLMEDS